MGAMSERAKQNKRERNKLWWRRRRRGKVMILGVWVRWKWLGQERRSRM